MELQEMIYDRLRNDEDIESMTASFDGGAAVFYQMASPQDDARWESAIQYPRIDYLLDMMDNPARNANGTLIINIWCDTQGSTEPEDIERRIKTLLHASFAQADDYPYCFSWNRSDAFEIKKQQEETVRIVGVTVSFDVIACPKQETTCPDPIKALNDWTKEVLPDAKVICRDEIEGWFTPTKETPAVYWRMTSEDIKEQHFAYTWLNMTAEGHVYAPTADDRLHTMALLKTAASLIGHIPMEDGSPLLQQNFESKPQLNYPKVGQLKFTGSFGILQPKSHLSNCGTGRVLADPNYGFTD